MAGDTTYKNSWAKGNLDRISLIVPKGQRAKLQAHAKRHEESLNGVLSNVQFVRLSSMTNRQK